MEDNKKMEDTLTKNNTQLWNTKASYYKGILNDSNRISKIGVNKYITFSFKAYELIDDVGYKEFMDREPTIGMSDDSLKNIEALLRRFGKDPSIKIISTAGGEKKKLT